MKNVEAVVFDFNGTLFFDYKENRDAWNVISLKYRGREFDEKEYNASMGMTDRMTVNFLFGEMKDEENDRLSIEKENIYLELCRKRKLTLEKDAVTFIKELKSDNIKVLVASSCPKINMAYYKTNLGLLDLFDEKYIIYGRDDIPGKPAPDIFRLALSRAGVEGKKAACFEDAPNGIRAALSTPFHKVYAVHSPGLDDSVQKSLTKVIDWSYTLLHYDEVISL